MFTTAPDFGDEVEIISIQVLLITTSPVTSVDGNTVRNICSYKCKCQTIT